MPPEADVSRVLIVHAQYRQPGGEEAVVAAETELLRSRGHEVDQLIFDNRTWAHDASPGAQLRQVVETVWSARARTTLAKKIGTFHPQVIHVHNTFPSASPAVYSAASRAGIPLVQSLHNYRLMCPAGTFYRDGHTCTDCLGRRAPLPGVVHACYRGSHRATAVTSSMLTFHNLRRTWQREVDHFICETEFARDLFLAGGLDPTAITVKPNFLEPDPANVENSDHDRTGFVFVGRLSDEKGIATMLRAAREVPGVITVVGSGPLEPQVVEAAREGLVTAAGYLDAAQLHAALNKASALIFPSHSFEGFPMTIVEAFAHGLPVIASSIGGLPSIVDAGRTGVLFPPRNPHALAECLRWALAHPSDLRRMGISARDTYLANFRGDRNYGLLMGIYAAAAARARSRHRDPRS